MSSAQWMTGMRLGAVALAAAGFLNAAPALAANCEATMSSGDMIKFDKELITIDPSCKEFTVKLEHKGKMAKNVMGHNWVLAKAADINGIAMDGIKAGLNNDYLKPDDARVLAHTKVIGGGEETSVTFSTDKLAAGQEYLYFCSFPGHSTAMRGTIAIGKEK